MKDDFKLLLVLHSACDTRTYGHELNTQAIVMATLRRVVLITHHIVSMFYVPLDGLCLVIRTKCMEACYAKIVSA